MKNRFLKLLERLRKSSEVGLRYAKNEHDIQRYKAIKDDVHDIYSLVMETSIERIDPIEKKGYITPKLGVNAIIERQNGEILLEQRVDDGLWGIPGGWCEVGLSIEENLIKELKEETGYIIEIEEIIGVMSRTPTEHFPYTSYHILYKSNIISGELKVSHESTDVDWKDPQTLENWHFDHKEWWQFYSRKKN